jgi:hypothetical protein
MLFAPRLLSLRRDWMHGQYSSPRYFGFVGNGVYFTDTILIVVAAGVAATTIVRLSLATGAAIWLRDWRQLRPSAWLLVGIPAWATIVYLTYVANFPEMTKEMFIPGP